MAKAKTKSPRDVLDKAVEKATKLLDKDRFAEALALLEPAFAALPPGEDELDGELVALGMALRGVGRYAEARAAFERSDDHDAALNLVDMLLEDLKQPREAIARTLAMRQTGGFGEWTWRYLARGYLDVGDVAGAERELRDFVAHFEIDGAKKIAEVRADLEAYGGAALPFLAWVAPKAYDVTLAQAKELRAWWKTLPIHMRNTLGEGMEDVEKPSDAEIARTRDVDTIELEGGEFSPEPEGCEIDDPSIFLVFPRLARLSFYGEPASVEMLRPLGLEQLALNNTVIKDYVVPRKVDRALWKAAEAGNKAAVKKALAAGASVLARGEHGQTALAMAAGNDDLKLVALLIAAGSDPWAGDHLGSSEPGIFGAFADEDRPKIEAMAKRANIPHPRESPWRVLGFERRPKAAVFADQDGLDEGRPLAATWPANAKLVMEKPKASNKLYDLHRIGYRGFAVSETIAALVRVSGVELLPVKVQDLDGKVRGTYYVLNPPAIDCLDLARCHPSYNFGDDAVGEIAAHAIDPVRVGDAQMFRCVHATDSVIVTRALADRLTEAGLTVHHVKR